MTWECGCGVVNRDSRVKCSACGTPKGMVPTPHGFKPADDPACLEIGAKKDCGLANLSVFSALASWTVLGGAMFGEIKPPEGALMLIVATSLMGVLLGHVAMFRIMRSRGKLKGLGSVFAALGMSYPLLLGCLPLVASLFRG